MVKNFTIQCSMEERWISAFMSMLQAMENYGKVGHSTIVGIYSDGDGDFRPKFETNVEFKKNYPYPDWFVNKHQTIYDADYDKTKEQWNKDCEFERRLKRKGD